MLQQRFFILVFLLTTLGVSSQQKEDCIVLWDSSTSMTEFNVNAGVNLLKNFYKESKNNSVTIIGFNAVKTAPQTILITKEQGWSAVVDVLNKLTYDGAANYNLLEGAGKTNANVFLFTVGKGIGEKIPNIQGNVTVVASKQNKIKFFLKTLAANNNGVYQELELSKKDENKIVNIQINGSTVLDENIYVLGKKDTLQVIKKIGNYTFNVGDTKKIRVFRGNKQLAEKEIANKYNTFNFSLGKNNYLEEVFVAGNKKKVNSIKRNTVGEINKGYNEQTLKQEDLNSAPANVKKAIDGKLVGVNIKGDLSNVKIRNGGNSILMNNYGMVIIDGVSLSRSNSSSNLSGNLSSVVDPNNIAEIKVLKGLAATNIYGSDGANGVLIIKTITGSVGEGSNSRKNTALLKNNVYKEEEAKGVVNKKDYLKFYKGLSTEDAYKLYLNQRYSYQDNPEYYFEVYEEFKKRDKDIATNILLNVYDNSSASYEQLRTLLFKLRQQKDSNISYSVAKRLLKDFPDKIQSYLDMAVAYKNNGEFQESLDMLEDIRTGNANNTLDFSPLTKVVVNEIKNLVFKYKSKLDTTKLAGFLLSNKELNARVIVEWSSSSKLFDLQFVNPQKRFFKWEHNTNNEDRVIDENEKGYGIEEFEITGGKEIKGDWIIDVNNSNTNENNLNELPLYLKCTVVYNFGTSRQREATKVISLNNNEKKKRLVKIKI